MLWYAVMISIIPFLLWPKTPWRGAKVRSWLTVMGASLATYIEQSLPFYTAICFVGAAVVLSHPMSNWQRLLGWSFIVMAGLNIGFMANQYYNVQIFLSVSAALNALSAYQHGLGWAMIATLFAWGGYDGLRRITDILGALGGRVSGPMEL